MGSALGWTGGAQEAIAIDNLMASASRSPAAFNSWAALSSREADNLKVAASCNISAISLGFMVSLWCGGVAQTVAGWIARHGNNSQSVTALVVGKKQPNRNVLGLIRFRTVDPDRLVQPRSKDAGKAIGRGSFQDVAD